MKDSKIVKGCKRRDAYFQRALLEKYSGQLMAVALRYAKTHDQAEDALQETWIKVFNNIDQYEEKGKLFHWIKRILINTTLRMHRNKPRIEDISTFSHNNTPQVPANAEMELQIEDLMKIIETTPRPGRDVFMLFVIEGFSHKEIAEMMDIKESTSRVHLTNARKYLRSIVERHNQELSK